ncbi:DoxX family protein [Fibrella aquatilis]|uniref:DoxX family protein n=1 Tax=Fibrella aquatilis TaxID=2817059 RepID=A0A939GB62_9BACT|nr:DoxX family protein [Fibrella aquatilis]MBO0934325.1 DoxX family protein [Fibrella aquatilis]
MNTTLVIFYLALLVISFVYLAAGFQKISGREPMKSRMAEMNQGGVVRLLIGIAEIVGVIGIWLPATRPLALLCLMPFSIGGLAAHIVLRHNFRERDIPAVLMIVLICVALWLDPSFSIIFN